MHTQSLASGLGTLIYSQPLHFGDSSQPVPPAFTINPSLGLQPVFLKLSLPTSKAWGPAKSLCLQTLTFLPRLSPKGMFFLSLASYLIQETAVPSMYCYS